MLEHFNLSFCEEYNYPKDIKEHFVKILEKIVSKNILSVILVGSTSKGELAFDCKQNSLRIYSDYELLVVTKVPVNYYKRTLLRKELMQLSKNIYTDNPYFHIDFTCVSLCKLKKLPPTLFTFDARSRGKTIYGEEFISDIPVVNTDNLDFRNLNEILIWRLWSLLLYLPVELFKGFSLKSELEKRYSYIICKNVLDLTGWILPYENILISTVSERVAHIRKNYKNLKLSNIFEADFIYFLEECLEGKLRLKFNKNPQELYLQAIKYYFYSIRYLFYTHDYKYTDDDILLLLDTHSKDFFKNFTPKEKLLQIAMFMQTIIFKRDKFDIKLSAVFNSNYGRILRLLFYLHFSLCSIIDKSEVGSDYFDKAWSLAVELGIANIDLNVKLDRISRLFCIKKSLSTFMLNSFYWIKSQEDLIEKTLDGCL